MTETFAAYAQRVAAGDPGVFLGQLVWYSVSDNLSVEHSDVVAAMDRLGFDKPCPSPSCAQCKAGPNRSNKCRRLCRTTASTTTPPGSCFRPARCWCRWCLVGCNMRCSAPDRRSLPRSRSKSRKPEHKLAGCQRVRSNRPPHPHRSRLNHRRATLQQSQVRQFGRASLLLEIAGNANGEIGILRRRDGGGERKGENGF